MKCQFCFHCASKKQAKRFGCGMMVWRGFCGSLGLHLCAMKKPNAKSLRQLLSSAFQRDCGFHLPHSKMFIWQPAVQQYPHRRFAWLRPRSWRTVFSQIQGCFLKGELHSAEATFAGGRAVTRQTAMRAKFENSIKVPACCDIAKRKTALRRESA